MKYIKANEHAHGAKRPRADVRYIIIHYTGTDYDRAENNARYFQKWNTRSAGAHFFIDRDGTIIKSVALNLVAWSVGGKKYVNTKGGSMHGVITNANSVSIELCDNLSKDPSPEQIEGVKKCIKYIRKYCKNANDVYRHYDVTGKQCPARMVSDKKWQEFKRKIGE